MGKPKGLLAEAPVVVYLDHSPVFGGAEQSLLLLLANLDTRKYRPVLVTEYGSALEKAARAAGIDVRALSFGRIRLRRNPVLAVARLFTGVWALGKLVRRERGAIVHANVMRMAPYGALAARLGGAKFVWHVRDIHRERWFSRAIGQLAGAVIANSAASARALPAATRRKTKIVHNGIDLGRFTPEKSNGRTFRDSIGVPYDAPLVANIGWAAPWKNLLLFVRAAGEVLKVCPDARFVIVGEASDERYAEYWRDLQHSAERELGERICFAGRRDDVPEVLAGIDVLLHTAIDEPFGRVIVEAMAMEKPVVALTGGGVDEIVVDGKTGYLVDSTGDGEEADRLGCAVANLLDDPDRARAFGRAGRERVLQRFDARVMARKIEEIYSRML